MAKKTMTEMMRKGLEKGMPTQEDVDKWKKTESAEKKLARTNAALRKIVSPTFTTEEARNRIRVDKLTEAETNKITKDLKAKAKSLLIKKPNMTITALKTALRAGSKFIPHTIAASVIAEIAMYAYEHRTSGPTTDPVTRKRSRHGETKKYTGDEASDKYYGGGVYPRRSKGEEI